MLKNTIFVLILLAAPPAWGDVAVKTVDFLPAAGARLNAAGPLWVQADPDRNRVIVANTLSSALSIIDGSRHTVLNIPLAGRSLQHLKAEAMTIRRQTGEVYLIGANCFHIVDPAKDSAVTLATGVQFESITVDETTGNAFITGRESKEIGFYEAASKQFKKIPWLEQSEKLINLNQTPPPPIRKVICANELNQVVAVDGFTSTLYLFETINGQPISSKTIPLTSGGRWHLAGYNEKNHCLYLVTETSKRHVIEAGKINVVTDEHLIIPLPEFTEGVGIIYNPDRDEVYIPYDNFPSVHVADFKGGGSLEEIKLPAYGNDASAIDFENSILYVASWAHGEIDVIDLEGRKLLKRIPGLGIIPHMFSLTFNANTGCLYFPKGATAVNGTFGSAVSVLDPASEKVDKVHLGWAPIDLIELPDRNSFLVFNSEDQFAEVFPDGRFDSYDLPYDYPVQAVRSPEGNIYLSYGPHQSYWPNVYIWDAKNGVLTINQDDFSFYDRRIPRQAHELVLDEQGALNFTQNNWGTEPQFIGRLLDEVRLFEARNRIAPGDTVTREITQRILEYDAELHRLYLVRLGEGDEDPSILQIIDTDSMKTVQRFELGLTATDLVFDDTGIYVANFSSNTVSVITKKDFTVTTIATGRGPLKLVRQGGWTYVINHLDNTLQAVGKNGRTFKLPDDGYPDNLFVWNNQLIITSHSPEALFISRFDPETNKFSRLHKENYPFGETRFDSGNVSFYVNGQFGDAVFSLNQIRADKTGRLWVTDFLAGQLYIIEGR
jgi:YVTN family beta-propeller protein